jgi:hypothetical protein
MAGEKRSFEFIAVWMTLAFVALVAFLFWAIDTESTLAWLLFVVAAATLLVLGYLRWAKKEEVANVPRPAAKVDDGFHRVLVVVDDGATSEAFNQQLLETAAGKPEKAFVVAPAVGSKLDRLTGDQAAYDNAEAQLNATLQALDALGIEATGKIGSHDPLQATVEALREFPADAVILATHDSSHAKWLEEGLVAKIGKVTTVPVSHVVVD